MKRKTIFAILIITSILFVNKVNATERISQEEFNKSSYSAMQEESKQNEIMLLADIAEEPTVVETWDISATENDNVIATLISDETLTISGTGNMKNYYYYYESGRAPWYEYKDSIKLVKILGTVNNISDYAFSNCDKIQKVIIENGVKTIGTEAFNNCTNLKEINFPNTITQITYLSFADCKSLTKIVLPGSLKKIGARTFLGCSSLSSVTIEEGLEEIYDWTFSSCNLKEINLPSTLKTIGTRGMGCTTLININVDSNNKNYSSYDGILFNKNKTSLICYPCGKEETTYSIPEGVITIGSSAFSSNTKLTTINLPSTLKNIGSYAFEACNLTSINLPDSITSIGNYAFYGCTKISNINLPRGITKIADNTFGFCKSLENIKILDGVKSIGNSVFSGCDSLKNITIPTSVTNIGSYTFDRCKNLTNVIIPDSVIEIGSCVFRDCESLVNIRIPKNLKDISINIFNNCKKLNSISIPCVNEYAIQYLGEQYRDKIEIIHDVISEIVEENKILATCKNKGSYDEVVYCRECHEIICRTVREIPATGHSYETKIIAPTKTEQGYMEHTCSKCGESYRDNYIPALGEDELIMKINEIENLYKVQLVQGVEYVLVQPETTKENLRKQIVTNGEYEILNKDKQVKEKDILATSDVIKFKEKEDVEYIIIVKGDVDGNGIIDFLGDIVLLNNYRLGRIKEISVESKLAGDIDENGEIDFINDIVKMNNYRIGILHQLNK